MSIEARSEYYETCFIIVKSRCLQAKIKKGQNGAEQWMEAGTENSPFGDWWLSNIDMMVPKDVKIEPVNFPLPYI